MGPRPLPAHLTLAVSLWATSSGAWRNWKTAWPNSIPTPASPDADLAVAVSAAADRRLLAFVDGVLAYRRHPFRHRPPSRPVVWSDGATRLYQIAPQAAGRPVLLVPSLINRSTILDLGAGPGFARWLGDAGMAPFLIDWGEPGVAEDGFSVSDYVAGRLEAALDHLVDQGGQAPILLGYCLGGLLALAAAVRRRRDVAGLILMATPWDLHAPDPSPARALATIAAAWQPLIDAAGSVPVDALQLAFMALDPFQTVTKFRAFGALDPRSAEAESFVAVEDWVNDGVPLAAAVAREVTGAWYGQNLPALGRWRVAGRLVRPQTLDIPTLVVVPGHDRIVPPESAAAILDRLPRAARLDPPLGHVGMIVGRRAPDLVWHPVAEWVRALA